MITMLLLLTGQWLEMKKSPTNNICKSYIGIVWAIGAFALMEIGMKFMEEMVVVYFSKQEDNLYKILYLYSTL